MGLFSSLMGNISEVSASEAQQELSPILIPGETVAKAFHLFRDQVILTTHRVITIDKQGVTGGKQAVISIPYKSIKKFSKESAGLFDLDAELQIWITGEPEPLKWQFSKGVNINEVYSLLSQYVLAGH
ncbi:MAG: PH domain-containing protein [Verrucomicrobiaceae bacterium]|nr:MAG: PH domain-containing protein [Verrucomicrobiaceae bacterium]